MRSLNLNTLLEINQQQIPTHTRTHNTHTHTEVTEVSK